MTQRRTTNKAGVDLIRYFESLRLEAYQDIRRVWTVGYGHTGHDVVPGQTISETQANMLLASDLERFERGVERLLNGPAVSDNAFSALVSFVYNLGLGALATSTLLKYINSGSIQQAADEFLKWDHVGKTEIAGLLARRRAERELFLK